MALVVNPNNPSAGQDAETNSQGSRNLRGLYNHYKNFVVLDLPGVVISGPDGQSVDSQGVSGKFGAFFEKVQGGEVDFGIAEAAPANSRGKVYTATRFTLSEITLEGYLKYDFYFRLLGMVNAMMSDNNKKLVLSRTMYSSGGELIKVVFGRCSLKAPPTMDDADVTRDNENHMIKIRLQPESRKEFLGKSGEPVVSYDPEDQLNPAYRGLEDFKF